MTDDKIERKLIRDRERYYRKRDEILAQKREKHHLNKEAINAKQREDHRLNKEMDNRKSAEWRLANPDKASAYGKSWRLSNPERAIFGRIASTYNISLDAAVHWYNLSLASCDSCGYVWKSTDKKRLFIDHNHTTGEIRGILCHHCNSALGLLKEDENRILALLQYNRKHNGTV